MRYLDTSILVAALTREPRTGDMQAWLASQAADTLCISEWVITEFSSALSMKIRMDLLTPNERATVLHRFCHASGRSAHHPPGRHDGLSHLGAFRRPPRIRPSRGRCPPSSHRLQPRARTLLPRQDPGRRGGATGGQRVVAVSALLPVLETDLSRFLAYTCPVRPHPGNVAKMYVLDTVRRSLIEEGLI
jgi:hypothetical protein